MFRGLEVPYRRLYFIHLIQMTSIDSQRLLNLKEALDKVRAINGSPDIINSLLKAIEELQSTYTTL